jgi:formiminoglutamase
MNKPTVEQTWQGRIDVEDADISRRLHQHVSIQNDLADFNNAPVILGFECDEGVKRNQGTAGAVEGPNAIRQSMANLACSPDLEFYDIGNVTCDDEKLEEAQQQLADNITQVLEHNGRPFVLGGGHEMGWASYLGTQQYIQKHAAEKTLGILNFDAHFDLRNPEPISSSGTPFRQCQEWCYERDVPFHYNVMGINPSANTDALFQFAWENHVSWVEDTDCHMAALPELKQQLKDWLASVDYVYVTLCLDVFPAAYAPGVSAPAALGVEPLVVIKLLQYLMEEAENTDKKILLVDVAELNPSKDIDNRTAKLAARYVYQMML